MSDGSGRQFKDFAGYVWEAFEIKGREAGVPPGFRRIFFRSLDHPDLPPVPGPITTAPLYSLTEEQLRGFIKLRHALPPEGQKDAERAPRRETAAPIDRGEWDRFLRSVRETPGSPEPFALPSPLPSAGSEPRPSVEPTFAGLDESFYPDWLAEALGSDLEALAFGGGPAAERPGGLEGEAPGWSPQIPVHRRHLYRGFESSRLIPRRFQARVRVALHDQEFVGEAMGADVPGARVEVAARATLAALQRAEGNRVELALQGAKVVRAFDRGVVVVGVYGLNERDVTFLVGASLVRDSIEHSAILATLQATGRWLAWAASQKNGKKAAGDDP